MVRLKLEFRLRPPGDHTRQESMPDRPFCAQERSRMRFCSASLKLAAFGVATSTMLVLYSGCITRAEVCIKTAFQMYGPNMETLGPPPPHLENHVRTDIGTEAFLVEMERFVGTKYQAEALYALGWFGDARHVSLVARSLRSENPEIRRVAVSSFSRLVDEEFSNEKDAEVWWLANQEKYRS